MGNFLRVPNDVAAPGVTLVIIGWRGLEWDVPGVCGSGVGAPWQALRGRPRRWQGLSWHRPTWKPFGRGLGFSKVIDGDGEVGFSK